MSNRVDAVQAARVAIRLARVLDQRLRATGGEDVLGLAEFGVLSEVERGIALPSAIARASRLDPARVTRVVERLVQLGLVRRGANEQDRRQSPLALTEDGAARLAAARADVHGVVDPILAHLPPEQQELLATTLDEVERALSLL